MRITKIIYIVLGIILTIGSLGLVQARSSQREIWGILRPTQTGVWYVLNDSDHEPSGISSVEQTSTYIRVNHTSCFTKIHIGYANPDETLVINNTDTGFGAGFCYSIIFLSKDGIQVNPNTINYSGGNIWFYLKGN